MTGLLLSSAAVIKALLVNHLSVLSELKELTLKLPRQLAHALHDKDNHSPRCLGGEMEGWGGDCVRMCVCVCVWGGGLLSS